MIGKHIHTRIFLLVLLVILFLTLGAGLTFSVSSSWYVQYAAERDASAQTVDKVGAGVNPSTTFLHIAILLPKILKNSRFPVF